MKPKTHVATYYYPNGDRVPGGKYLDTVAEAKAYADEKGYVIFQLSKIRRKYLSRPDERYYAKLAASGKWRKINVEEFRRNVEHTRNGGTV